MKSWGRAAVWSWLLVLVLHFCSAVAGSDNGPYLADDKYKYKTNFSDNSRGCLTLSLEATITVSYKYSNESNITYAEVQEFVLPNNTVTHVQSYCSNSTRLLDLGWVLNGSLFNITFNFTVDSKEWYLSQVLFSFDMDELNFESPYDTGHQSYQTASGTHLFNRTFGMNKYFYCKACKQLWLTDSDSGSQPCFTDPATNKTVCSFLELSNSVIYVGDLDTDHNVKKKLCVEDFIELQEIIIPSVVGGILGLLLVVIFAAYLIAFIRRRRKEGYESLNDGY